jgi:WD40 repeat protein
LDLKPHNDVDIAFQIQLDTPLRSLAWSHENAPVLAVACDDQKLRLLDVSTENVLVGEIAEAGRIDVVDWNMVSTEHVLTMVNQQSIHAINLLDLAGPSVHVSQARHAQPLTCAAWNRHRALQYDVSDLGGRVWGIDLKQRDTLETFHCAIPQRTGVTQMARNCYHEHLIAVAGFDYSLHLFDCRNAAVPMMSYRNAHVGHISCLAWSPHDETVLATGSHDRTLRIWTTESGTRLEPSLAKPQKVEDWVNSLDWSVHEQGLLSFVCNDHLFKAYSVNED